MDVALWARNGKIGIPYVMDAEVITFPGGEPHVKSKLNLTQAKGHTFTIKVRANSAQNFMKAMALAQWVRRQTGHVAPLHLFMPYFPGAREDRGHRLTVKLYADIVNSMKFDTVTIVDPHSDVTPALIDRCEVVTMADLLAEHGVPFGLPRHNLTLVAPDVGATKRVEMVASRLGIGSVVQGFKHRDMTTGQLSGFSIEPLVHTEGRHYLILDDICDGGGTFLGLRDAMRRDYGIPVEATSLWVTHGIFSKGTALLKNTFANVGCTDSFKPFDQIPTTDIIGRNRPS